MIKTVSRSEINRANALKNPHRLKTHGGGYHAVHKWLTAHYGKANVCMDTKCDGTSKTFQWALLSGKKYEHNRDNFVMMCCKCHISYDRKPDRAKKAQATRELRGNHIAGWNKGLRKTHCKRGHDLEGNGYVRPDGYRACRICHKESEKRYVHKMRIASNS